MPSYSLSRQRRFNRKTYYLYSYEPTKEKAQATAKHLKSFGYFNVRITKPTGPEPYAVWYYEDFEKKMKHVRLHPEEYGLKGK